MKPCQNCTSPCTYPDCGPYRRWLERQWGNFRRWAQRETPASKPGVWRYDPPYLVKASLDRGPCASCPARRCCGDSEMCPSWVDWYNGRNRRIAWRLTHG
ncbi:MAG TPA: hypothetical protein IAB92_05855 [Candidatus Faecousia faecigallinarum]|nr:hypothetical protein [Candidatus Faecousia faecigallinarum]